MTTEHKNLEAALRVSASPAAHWQRLEHESFRLATEVDRLREEAAAATDAVTKAGFGPREMPLAALVTLMGSTLRVTEDERLRFLRERDEARAEVERLSVENATLTKAFWRLETAEEREARLLTAHRAECAVVDPKPTPPVDVPDLTRPTPPERPRAKTSAIERPPHCNAGAHWFAGNRGAVKPSDVCDCGERVAHNNTGLAMHPGLFAPNWTRPRVPRPQLRVTSGVDGSTFTLGGQVITPEAWAAEWVRRHGEGEPVLASASEGGAL